MIQYIKKNTMKILTQIRFYFVIVTIAFLSLLINYLNLKDDLVKCQTDKGYIPGGDIQKAQTIDSLTNLTDSLQNEIFVKGVELGRYEVALELFKEKNKNGADEFELILTTQTE